MSVWLNPARLQGRRAGRAPRSGDHDTDTDQFLIIRLVHWIVDGMNVIGTRPDRWWRDRDAAMLKLVDQLERWAAAEGEDVVVVFERKPSPPIHSTVIEVTNAPKPKRDAADEEIIRLLRSAEDVHAIRVVSSDRALVERAYSIGATVEGAESFRLRIEAAELL